MSSQAAEGLLNDGVAGKSLKLASAECIVPTLRLFNPDLLNIRIKIRIKFRSTCVRGSRFH